MSGIVDGSAWRVPDTLGEYSSGVDGFVGLPTPPSEALLTSLSAADAAKLMHAYYGAWHACARVAGSATGEVSPVPSVSSKGSATSAWGRAKFLKSWRLPAVKSRPVSAVSSVSSLVSGVAQSLEEDFMRKEERIRALAAPDLCYLRTVRLDCLDEAFSVLKSKPSFADLVQSPARWFEPVHVLRRLGVSMQHGSESQVHVHPWGRTGYSTFLSLCLSFDRRELGLAATFQGEPKRTASFVNGKCRVGAPAFEVGTEVKQFADLGNNRELNFPKIREGVTLYMGNIDPTWGLAVVREHVGAYLKDGNLFEVEQVVGKGAPLSLDFVKHPYAPYVHQGDEAKTVVEASEMLNVEGGQVSMITFVGKVDFGDGEVHEGKNTVVFRGNMNFRPLGRTSVRVAKLVLNELA